MICILQQHCQTQDEGDGEVELSAGDSVYQTPGMPHELTSCSDDCELLEITLPAEFSTEDA